MRCLFTVHERKSKVYLFISTAPALTGNRTKTGTKASSRKKHLVLWALSA